LSDNIKLERLGLIIVDEQHRFGVQQRAKLRGKARGQTPHLLTMTATPIPRTLALTLYGDLDLSVINEMPSGRQIVKTRLVPPAKRNSAYQFLKDKVGEGRQVFIVTPLIEPSENLTTLKSAKEEFTKLSQEVFPDLRLGLLHGRLKSKEKDEVLTKFRDHQLDILVSTPVVEVGIDIPNATIMMIEGSERFGLAQLHQLRGRVGRSHHESWCFLFSEDPSSETNHRLKSLETHHSGPELAEIDMKLRGPGEIYGLRQSGIPDLKVASLSDTVLIETTSQAAEDYLKEVKSLPESLLTRLQPLLETKIASD
jgi:ATP-dependent DNA helicase RecG